MSTGRWTLAGLVVVAVLTVSGPTFGRDTLKPAEVLKEIQIDVTTSQQVTELLGPPVGVARYPRRAVEAWQYYVLDSGYRVEISIEVDSKGIVRSVQRIRHHGP